MAADVPLGTRTPVTRNGRLLMRIVCPIGSVAAKRFLRTVSPITATLADISTSFCVKADPSINGQLRIRKYCGSVPFRRVAQLSLPNTTCPLVLLPGAAASARSEEHTAEL